MKKELRLLILEDVTAHAELMERELRKAEMVFSAKRVATKEAFLEELQHFNPDSPGSSASRRSLPAYLICAVLAP